MIDINDFIEALDERIKKQIKSLDLSYIETGVIKKINKNGTYSVEINGETYDNLKTLNGKLLSNNDIAKILIPNAKQNQKFILGKVSEFSEDNNETVNNHNHDNIYYKKNEIEEKIIQINKRNDTYVHTQILANSLWTINHNLNKLPSITIVDSAGSEVIGDIKYIDNNNINVSFTASFSGKAYLN